MRKITCFGILLLVVVVGCGGDDGVAPSNRAPVVGAQADTSISPGDTLVLWATATDPDGDALTLGLTVFVTASQIRAGDIPDTDFDSSTGRFEFRAVAGDRPSREFAFTATDTREATGSTKFTVTVN
jgi:hypothetical protein